MCGEVTVQRRQLLRHDVFQHSLKHTSHGQTDTDRQGYTDTGTQAQTQRQTQRHRE